MTSANDVRDELARHPFTAGLDARHVDVLAGLATLRHHVVGEWITRQGLPADACHLVVAGRAAIEVSAPGRDPLVIATVHAGETLGWSWLVSPHRWHFDVIALDQVTSVALDGPLLRAACDADHDLGYEIVTRLASVMAARLESSRLQLVDVYAHRP